MKFLILLGLITVFVGCASQPNQTSKVDSAQHISPEKISEHQVINFVGLYDLTLELETTDNFETAVLTDNSDAKYQLKRTISANGIRLESPSGVILHFKNTVNGNQGYVELVKDKPIEIQEFKK